MADEGGPLTDRMLDDHLDQLDPADRAELRSMLAGDERLSAQHRRLQRVLEPLDAWTAPSPPAGFVDRILSRIAAAESDASHYPVYKLTESEFGSGSRGRSRIAMRDLIAVAAVLVFFFGILAPSSSMIRERSRRAQCVANLGGIGRAVSAYALANSNALPYDRRSNSQTSFLPIGSTGSSVNIVYSPNIRSVLILARQGYVANLQVFICPSQRQSVPLNKMNLESIDAVEPNAGRRLCSYDSLNMSGPTPNYSLNCEQPYMADSNPLFSDGRFTPVNASVAYSPNHRRAGGQNVLRMDGSTQWYTTPNCGLRGDNIWQAGSITVYRGTEVQESSEDTFLVP